MKWRRGIWLVVALAASLPSSSSSQQEMRGMALEGGWRMIPMDARMPMLPGLTDVSRSLRVTSLITNSNSSSTWGQLTSTGG